MKRLLVVCILVVALAACNSTEGVLKKYTGRTIADFIAEKHYYPDSSMELPTGGKVYRFTVGSGARGHVDDEGNVQIRSNVCRVWIETDKSGIIVHWRYENCR